MYVGFRIPLSEIYDFAEKSCLRLVFKIGTDNQNNRARFGF